MTPGAPELLAALVDHLQAVGVLSQPPVAAAFRAVPRHLFLPGVPVEEVYRDEAIPTKMAAGRAISASSQPAIMAIMLEQLDVHLGQRVLEIGAGTGYNAALLGCLVGPSGSVVTVDIDDDIVDAARSHLATAGIENVRVVLADGGEGYAPDGPYDRIIATAGAWEIAPAWYDQLVADGRLVLPLAVGNGVQSAIAFDKPAPAGQPPLLVSQSIHDCGFMPLRGAFAGPEVITPIGEPGSGLTIISPRPLDIPAGQISDWLAAGAERSRTGLLMTEAEIYGSLMLWLDARSDALATLTIEQAPPPPGGWPCLFQSQGQSPTRFTVLMHAAEGMAVLDGRDRSTLDASQTAGNLGPFELKIIAYGAQGSQIAQTLLARIGAWDRAGRPPSARLQVRVLGREDPYTPAPGETVVVKRWTRLVVTWPSSAATTAQFR